MPEPHVELRNLAPPPELYVPLLTRDLPLVAGTDVRPGDCLLRDPPEHADVPLPRAPLAGTLIGERPVTLTSGRTVPAVILRVDAYHHEAAPRVLAKPFTEQIQQILRARPGDLTTWSRSLNSAGVWASRSTCPDLSRQLADSFGADTVICTLLDPDPNVPLCARLAEEFAADIVAGAVLTARLANAERLLIVVEPTVPDRAKRELSRLASEISSLAKGLSLSLNARAISYNNAYPNGDTSLLLLNLLSRRLPPGQLPTARGVVLLDAPAALAIGRVARHDAPLTHIPIALTDHTRKTGPRSTLIRCPVGTPISHLLSAIGLTGNAASANAIQLRTGDVLQERTTTPSAVVSPEGHYLHVLARRPFQPPDPCVRCGWCVEACPTGAHPADLLEAAQTQNPTKAAHANLSSCIQCGLCQYVCPSRLPLLSAIRSLTRKGAE